MRPRAERRLIRLGIAAQKPLDIFLHRIRQRNRIARGIDRQIETYRSRDAGERRSIVGLQPKRADVIPAGALILEQAMVRLDTRELVVSDRGLRWGLLADRFKGT